MSSSSGGSDSIHQQRMLLRGVPGGEAMSACQPWRKGPVPSGRLPVPGPQSPIPSSHLPQQQRRLQAEPLPRRNLPEVGLSWHCAM